MSVHYKFKSALDYDTVTFDGLHISVGDLKAAISQQKRIGKTSDFDLEITNAQTKEVYVDDHTLIPKNTSLLVARVPLSQQPKKHWDGSNNSTSAVLKDVAPNKGLADLSRMEGSEQDKINAMISQSTFDYDPSNYQKIRGQNQRGIVPTHYTCYKCQKRGHWIKDCPLANSSEPVEIRRSTGIPQSFMVPVEGPKAPGAMMTPTGSFAVPVVDREAYLASESAGGGDTPTNAPAAPETAVPDELICSLCRDLLTDAVMIPCCGNSFCDECIRGALLESEDHECPDCREKEIAPTTLIPNRFLRNSVLSFKNQTGYSRRMPHRAPANVEMPLILPQRDARPAAVVERANGPVQPAAPNANEGRGSCEESDGSGDDNITVKVPPAHAHVPRAPPARHPRPARAILPPHHRHSRHGPAPGLKPPGIDAPVNAPLNIPPRIDEQRASTPTVDERRDPMAQPIFNRGPPSSQFVPGGPPSARQFNAAPFGRPPLGARGPAPFNDRFPREPYQPPPPGIKDSPNGRSEDPLEAFNRMIREKEMRAKRREERRRATSGSRSPRSRSPRASRSPRPVRASRSPRPVRLSRSPRPLRSPRSPRPVRSSRSPRPVRLSRSPRPVRSSRSPRPIRSSRSPRPLRSPRPVRASRSPRPIRSSRSPRLPRGSRSPRIPRGSRSPRLPRGSRSPRLVRSSRSPRPPRSPRGPRSPRSPRVRIRGRSNSRLRYSRSRSMSRGRMRRSPWSPRRRRTRERTLSLTRSPSPRRRHRSPMRYRSPLRSPLRSPPRSPPSRSPLRSPHRVGGRSPPPRPLSPHRYAGVYDELLSPPRRNVEPPYGARYGPRNNLPPSNYPPMGVKPIPQLMNMALPTEQPPLGYRGRYEVPPFDGGPPGVEPPIPGFEPPPFEKPPFGPSLAIDRDRLQPAPFRDPYGPRPPPYEGPGGLRQMPLPIPNEIQVHVGEARFRDNFRPGPPTFRDQGPVPFRDGQPFRDATPQAPYRDPNFRGAVPPFRDGPYRNIPFREGAFRENPPHGPFREAPPGFRPPSTDIRDPREPVPPNFHDPNYRDNYRDEGGVPRDARPGYRPSARSRGAPRRHPTDERHREREGRDGNERDRYMENREASERVERARDPERSRDPDRKQGREGRPRDERIRDYEKERDHERLTPEKKSRGSPKRSRETRDKKRSESRGRSRERDRDSKRDKKEEKSRDKSSPDKVKEHKEKDKKIKDRKKKKREKEKDGDKKKKREKKERKDKDTKKDEELGNGIEEAKVQEEVTVKDEPVSVEPILEQNEKPEITEDTVNLPKSEISLKTEPEEKQLDDLYGDESAETVDKKIMETYVKTEENAPSPNKNNSPKNIDINKEEPFDGIELQANTDDLDLKLESEVTNSSNKEMLAPLPELSKWEVDDDNPEKTKEPGEITSPETEEDGGKVTSDVIKRAENAIFAKAINSLRPIEIKKISSDRIKLYGDEPPKSLNNIQITVPAAELDQRSIEINEKKPRYSKTPPPRLSVKERLGGKVDDARRAREPRIVQSTVELVKSRSKTPKKEQPYRRVTVEKEKGRKLDAGGRETSKIERRVISDSVKTEKRRGRSPHEKKEFDKNIRADKKKHDTEPRDHSRDKKVGIVKSARERKKSTLDEANFEPDYDETLEFDIENKTESAKKRERSSSPPGNELKKPKMEAETIKLDLTNVKKKPDSDSESTSDSGESSSSSSSDARKKKKKKKRAKKKKKRAASDSDSESDSSQDDHKKKKKKRKHKKKSSKKKSKKSKHK